LSTVTGLCDWIISIGKYYDAVVSAEPKKQAFKARYLTLSDTNAKKEEMDAVVKKLTVGLNVL
jgi:hypothetical protein